MKNYLIKSGDKIERQSIIESLISLGYHLTIRKDIVCRMKDVFPYITTNNKEIGMTTDYYISLYKQNYTQITPKQLFKMADSYCKSNKVKL